MVLAEVDRRALVADDRDHGVAEGVEGSARLVEQRADERTQRDRVVDMTCRFRDELDVADCQVVAVVAGIGGGEPSVEDSVTAYPGRQGAGHQVRVDPALELEGDGEPAGVALVDALHRAAQVEVGRLEV